MKTSTILLIAAVIVIIGVVGYFIFFANNGVNGNSGTSGTGTVATSITQAYPNAPTGTRFSLGTASGTVAVNNFYSASGTQLGEDGVLILAQTSSYWITYDPSNSSFWLAISGTPFKTAEPPAEQAFLSLLDVSKADACKLQVTVGVPYASGSSASGQSYLLSFCE